MQLTYLPQIYRFSYLNDIDGDMAEVRKAAEKARDMEADLIVMDCIGFTKEAKSIVASIAGKPVLLCRTTLARTVSEMLDI